MKHKRKKNALQKDFIMEIRKSMGRFLSILFIVILGVAIFVGIRATQPDMLMSGDKYVDENDLMDIKVVSTYGLTQDDAQVIERLPAIDSVEGSYSVDVLCDVGENKKVIHVMAFTESVNKATLVEGRMPRNIKECLVDEAFLEQSEYEIGDTIVLESGTEDSLSDTLKESKFKIVGSADSPLYFSTGRGSSTVGNGTVSGFILVKPDVFTLDIFTEIYIKVEGAKEVTSFTEEYDAIVEKGIEQIELIQNVRSEVRRNELAKEAQLQIDDARKELNEKKEEAEGLLQENENKLESAQLEITLGKFQIESGKAQIETNKAIIESGKAEIASAKAELESGKQELETSKASYYQILNTLEEEKAEIQTKIDEWNDKIAELETNGATEAEIEVAKQMVTFLQDTMNESDLQIKTIMAQMEAELAAGEQQIKDAQALIAEKEKELLDGEKELLAAEKKLKDSQSQITSGEKELSSGKAQLEEAKQELETQIADGEAELEKAEKEISGLEMPTWYIFDRSSIPDYTGYGDNAARIASLAVVFPSIFFLVAALISLTTMTRMVEEQRVQIGTLKALGYSNFAIMKKYVNYALCATLAGCILGTLIGEKALPYIIIAAYQMTVYHNIPYILLPYQLGVGLAATTIAVFCTCGATIASCYKELLAQPAVLMRPQAPTVGKRTLVERIPFLWKRLNFTWKSSLRNLFRYKKRFFMTLFGIGGCMGLLMVGYGLRDSISSIPVYQFEKLQLYDSSVFIDENMSKEVRKELDTYLEDKHSISSVMDVRMNNVTVKYDDEKVDAYITVIKDLKQAETFFTYQDRKTKEIYSLSDEGIILTEKASQLLGVKAGEELILSEEGKKEYKVKVTAICENYVANYVYMTATLYEKLYGKVPSYNNLLLKITDDVTFEEIEHIGEEVLKFEDVLNVQYTRNSVDQLNGMLIALDRVMIILILIAGTLSFVVLYNLNNINITERRRELATLKVLGFYDMEVANYVYRENIMLTIFGVLVGCVLGKWLHYFTVVTVEVDEAMFGREVFFMSYVTCALFTIGFSAFVNLIMYFKLKKINMVESLKSVE